MLNSKLRLRMDSWRLARNSNEIMYLWAVKKNPHRGNLTFRKVCRNSQSSLYCDAPNLLIPQQIHFIEMSISVHSFKKERKIHNGGYIKAQPADMSLFYKTPSNLIMIKGRKNIVYPIIYWLVLFRLMGFLRSGPFFKYLFPFLLKW